MLELRRGIFFSRKFMDIYYPKYYGKGNRNRNDNQLELNACMLAPTPF